jgi:hypothetical protein
MQYPILGSVKFVHGTEPGFGTGPPRFVEFGKKEKRKKKVPNQKSCTKHVGYQKGYD